MEKRLSASTSQVHIVTFHHCLYDQSYPHPYIMALTKHTHTQTKKKSKFASNDQCKIHKEINLNIEANSQLFSAVIKTSPTCRRLEDRLAFFVTDFNEEIVWKYCQSVQKHTLRRAVSMETQTGHETTLRWILCVAPPAELVHLGFIFFLVHIFLFLPFFHLHSHCSAADPNPTSLPSSFIHPLSVSLPLTCSVAKIQEKR